MNGAIIPKSYTILSDAVEEAIGAGLLNDYTLAEEERERLTAALHGRVMVAIDALFHFPDLELYGGER